MAERVVLELIEILARQRKLYQELLQTAKAKQPILVTGDLTAINEFTIQEEKIVIQLGKLEDQRGRVQQALANHFNVPEAELTLKTLVGRVSPETQQQLEDVGKGLEAILVELKAINSMNSELVKQSLDYIEFTINVLTGTVDMLIYPEKPGEVSKEQTRARIFDRRI